MGPESLIYSPDRQLAAELSTAVRRLGWIALCVDRAGTGLELLRTRRYPAVIIDCIDQATSSGMLQLCRSSRTNRSAIVFAIAEQIDASTSRSANFILQRAPGLRELAAVFRVADGLVRQEFRRYRRVPAHVDMMVENDEHCLKLTTANISESGLCLLGEIRGWNREHTIYFDSPARSQFRASSSMVWSESGKIGMRFQNMSTSSRMALRHWLCEYD